MDHISSLSCGLLDRILMQNNVSIEDVINLGFTCKTLYTKIWKRKNNLVFQHLFFERWPALEGICKKKWGNEVDIGIELTKRLKMKTWLSEWFSKLIYDMEHHPNLEQLANQMEYVNLTLNNQSENSLCYYYCEDELIQILTDNRNEDNKITEIYYARKLLCHIKHNHLKKKWNRFIKLPVEQQTLERIAIMLSQWCQPENRLYYSHVSKMLDDFVQEILGILREKYPTHSILATSPEQFSFWERNNIDANHWDKTETRQIINVMRRHIYNRFVFLSGKDFGDLTCLLMDNILENSSGDRMSISLLFNCIARRLGVRCVFISSEQHYITLCWREDYNKSVNDPKTYYIIHISHDGEALKQNNNYFGESIKSIDITYNNNTQLVPYMTSISGRWSHGLHEITKITHCFLKCFLYMTDPRAEANLLDETFLWHKIIYADLTEYWMLKKKEIDITWEDFCEEPETLNRFNEYLRWQTCLEPKNRTEHLEYAIGMTVKIKDSKDYFEGVIVGWDLEFNDNYFKLISSQEEGNIKWQYRNSMLQKPFYKILCSSEKTLYVPEDVISKAKFNDHIDHNEIGRYFKSFNQTHYIPRMFLENGYPEDKAVRELYAAETSS